MTTVSSRDGWDDTSLTPSCCWPLLMDFPKHFPACLGMVIPRIPRSNKCRAERVDPTTALVQLAQLIQLCLQEQSPRCCSKQGSEPEARPKNARRNSSHKSIGLMLLLHLNLQPKRSKADWHKWGRTSGATEIQGKPSFSANAFEQYPPSSPAEVPTLLF